MLARILFTTLTVYFIVSGVESLDCPCITSVINQERCPGSGLAGYISGYGNCDGYENRVSGCFCTGCLSCDD
ncbi:hypothetical protein BDF21DRAFT_431167 [Thamnidium elegans]|nr:hypothetical protein BDF21DRAFT_431167 [Thamnidium elegans]